MTPEETEKATGALKDSEKYDYLTGHFTPMHEYKFQQTFMNKCNRAFQHAWLTKYPGWSTAASWMEGGLSAVCSFAINRASKGIFVHAPFTQWTKMSSVLSNHASLEYHLDSLTRSEEIRRLQENPRQTIRSQINTELRERVTRNKRIMENIGQATIYLRKQCIAFCGKREPEAHGNPGNFIIFLQLMAGDDEEPKSHLEVPTHKNATYLSPHKSE